MRRFFGWFEGADAQSRARSRMDAAFELITKLGVPFYCFHDFDLVEEAVLQEFLRISERGGVLGAMETGYQRSKIQEESMYYEMLKHTGRLPIIGVNTFRDPDADLEQLSEYIELARATESEKKSQLKRLEAFKKRNKKES